MVIPTLLLVTACSDRDREYYEANIEKAESKAEECENAMEAAFRAQDEEKLVAISKDSECNFAVDVFNEHKRKLARVKRELEMKAREEAQKEEERIFEQKYSEKMVAFKELPYADFFKMRQDCGRIFSSKKTPECKAYGDLKNDVEAREIGLLKEKYSNGKLEEYRDKSCKGTEFDEAYCALSRTAAQQQMEERIEYYVSNRDELKSEFNKCQKTYSELRKAQKWKESDAAIRTYQCSVVGKAAAKLKVYNFNKPIG